jgi:hypothetical protein
MITAMLAPLFSEFNQNEFKKFDDNDHQLNPAAANHYVATY